MKSSCCKCYCEKNGLSIPDKSMCIFPKDVIVLNRFTTERWEVNYGWFSYEGNRKICGWYLLSLDDNSRIKPIQQTDLYDIYILESN